MSSLRAFKAYDIRGRVADELTPALAYLIGRAYAVVLQPKKVALGRDVRDSSEALAQALTEGLLDAGVNVADIGLCGTEELYFATFHNQFDGGLMVTGSHNPIEYNGIKPVGKGASPITQEAGMAAIREKVANWLQNGKPSATAEKGQKTAISNRPAYVRHLMGYLNEKTLQPLKVVVNAGNGPAGLVIDALERFLPLQFIKINHQPDSAFPNGVPNPMLAEHRQATVDAVKRHQADLGVSWDGDFDRCFLFDAEGNYISCYYVVGLLSKIFLQRHPGGKIVYDPRLCWNTVEEIKRHGGEPIISKAGHTLMKAKMREVDAIFSGEVTGHYFFREFGCCDSGMIPWLMVADLMCSTEKTLAALVGDAYSRYPAGDEINLKLGGATSAVIEKVRKKYGDKALESNDLDGLSMTFDTWRFNLRPSNTEPLLRLNVETRADEQLLQAKRDELVSFIQEGV